MQRHSNITLGIIFSLALHALAFASWTTDISFDHRAKPTESLSHEISVNLVRYAKSAAEVITPKNIKTENIKTENNKADNITAESIIKAVTKNTVISQKLITKNRNPTLTNTTKTTITPIKTSNKTEHTTTPPAEDTLSKSNSSHTPAIRNDKTNQPDLIALEKLKTLKQKNEYIKRLLIHIEAYKFYPGSARRRSIEGNLHVTFFLSDKGEPDQLSINGGKSILQRAVRQALNDALPFPEPPSSLQLNQRISFNMNYQLQP